MGGVKGEEKCRRDGTDHAEELLGEGKGSHAWKGKLWDHWEGRGSKESVARFSLLTWVPRSLLRYWAWSSAHRGPPSCVGSEGVERGKGSKSKGQTSRNGTPEGWLGERVVPTPSGIHPWLGVQQRWGRPWGRQWGWGAKERKGTDQCFPCPLRHQGACWAPRPNPLPSEPPSCPAEPKPRPYTPTQGLTSIFGDPLQPAGPKPHPHNITQGLTSKLQNSTLQRPSFPHAASLLPHRY